MSQTTQRTETNGERFGSTDASMAAGNLSGSGADLMAQGKELGLFEKSKTNAIDSGVPDLKLYDQASSTPDKPC